MSDRAKKKPPPADEAGPDELEQARRAKLRRWREELGVEPYGRRVDGLITLSEARARFDQDAHDEFTRTKDAAKNDDSVKIVDRRARARVAGRCVQHRAMGSLLFIVIRDHSGDLQISVDKGQLDPRQFQVAKSLDYGDIIVAQGPVGATRKGEICIWAEQFEVHCKSLAPPPEKYHGLTDPELRYRRRYVDMYANPETIRVFQLRSELVTWIRGFMEERGYLEVETPIMQPIAGGAAARPFVTHHNALDIDLFLRIAPELYLKRLLVGGLPRVYEISRNFRNEGIDWQHNPEFTQIEAYQQFGDCWTMLELTESMLHGLAQRVAGTTGDEPVELPFGDLRITYRRPFARIAYGELFERQLGFGMTEFSKVRAKARDQGIEEKKLDDWLVVSQVYDRCVEATVDPAAPTFVTDYPSAISPLTRPQAERPELAQRWELLIGGMEIGTAYTELNDPDVQRAKFTEQLRGADEEEQTFRTLDEDFLEALRVGMPPAGGLGLGIDRIVMLMADAQNVRDVILFPLLKPRG